MSCTLIPSAIHVSELLDELYESAENVAEHETSDNEPENIQYNCFKTMNARKRKLNDDNQSKWSQGLCLRNLTH